MYILLLNKSNIAMSIAEAIAVLKPKQYNLFGEYLIIEGSLSRIKIKQSKLSFAFVKSINEIILIKDNIDDIKINLSSIKLSKYYKDNFKINCRGFGKQSDRMTKVLASLIINNLSFNKIKAKVEIKNPTTIFCCIKTDSKYILTKQVFDNKDNFKYRESKNLPEGLPTATSPKIAKAMINILGLKRGKILDPFCGSGGILIEANLLGHKITGYDIDKRALGSARLNLLHLGINTTNKTNVKLEMKDALKINRSFSAVVTDLPYGKNSKVSMKLEELYKNFFNIYSKYCKKMVVGMPSSIDKDIISKKWYIENFFEIYIHKSLSKRIYVLKRS